MGGYLCYSPGCAAIVESVFVTLIVVAIGAYLMLCLVAWLARGRG